ncbi:abc transporter g family member 11 [Quercus suber]|uniref:Abc transporter g family member 11 n=1 Tax=Quercus suber TaxID=58331 RepID=A0AAW0J076_QUESU
MILVDGFFRLLDDLPKPVFKYPLHEIAFHKYAFQGMFKNEFEGAVFSNDQARGPPIITGQVILRVLWQAEMGYSKWVNLARDGSHLSTYVFGNRQG